MQNIYFSRLDNGDWICYDKDNTTGDLYVDPNKIDLLFDLAKGTGGVWIDNAAGTWKTIFQYVDHPIPGFGKMDLNIYVGVFNGEIIRCTIRTGHEDEEIATFDDSFVLKLNSLPAFEPYQYPDSDVSDE